ncbi:hypothetical protein GcC1_020025b [Golovinomyces cichoracearum]|uniref:Uncharacterized protein n=1 Tax=Golovinomyces cichoracearum TaxID=62708 RepID=A0A420J570_9PEZI|nr:hypothetical protein GcC1_020025b [Golovinomyces cichoracearum]
MVQCQYQDRSHPKTLIWSTLYFSNPHGCLSSPTYLSRFLIVAVIPHSFTNGLTVKSTLWYTPLT